MLKEKLKRELEQYINDHLEIEIHVMNEMRFVEDLEYSTKEMAIPELDEFIKEKQKPTFQQLLFRFIDEKERKDSEIYNKAGIDRRHFSKIRSNPNYQPKKSTVLSLALALELDLEDTEEFLHSAGFSMNYSDKGDLVIQFFLERQNYNLHEINEALHHFQLQPLGI
ncbi:hypothetical protein RZN25_15065 [Bacillaceae bacterium S4-13-56]